MLNNLPLFKKGLLLLSIPFLFELIFLAGFYYLQVETKAEAERFARAREISDIVSSFSKEAYNTMTGMSLHDLESRGKLRIDRRPLVEKGFRYLKRLKQLVADSPDEIKQITEMEQILRDCDEQMSLGEAAWRSGDKASFENIKRTIRTYTRRLVTSDFVDFSRRHEKLVVESERSRELRQQRIGVLVACIPLSVVVAFLIGLVVSRSIVTRLQKLFDNSLRLARGQPLAPRIDGCDEIAELDFVFHQMAESLSEVHGRERDLINNSGAVFLVTDGQSKINFVNDASLDLFGYSADELLGKRLFELSGDENFRRLIESVIDGKELVAVVETVFLSRAGLERIVRCSLEWIEEGQYLMCVCHDLSEDMKTKQLHKAMIAMVAEDLRKPLKRIVDSHQFIIENLDEQSDSKTRQASSLVAKAARSTEKMMNLVSDLVDVEEIACGELTLSKSVDSACKLLADCAQIAQGMAAEKGVALETIVEPIEPGTSDFDVFCDQERILQVLINLTSNAIKFSSKGQSVVIRAKELATVARFEVEDKGRGIPHANTKTIFERFKQVEAADAKKKGGTGLGLAICRGLVELHGGAIWVDSQEGQGSNFIFEIEKSGNSDEK